MIRRLVPALFAVAILGAFGWTLEFLYDQSRKPAVVYETKHPRRRSIVRKTVAAGAIVPRREIPIKPRVSGILDTLHVEPGDLVEAGARIAEIRIVPNVVALNSAESRLSAAKISVQNREKEYARLERLFRQNILTAGQLNQAELDMKLARQEVVSATNNLELIKKGAIRGSGKVSNVVVSTVAGMVIEVPVEEGVSVIETNNFSEGTTIASIADMTDMVFQGFVDETEIGKLRQGMAVTITIGALRGEHFPGKLEHIAPKGTDRDGTIEFEVRAALELPPGGFVRANYSANADIILDERTDVLAIDERLLTFDRGRSFVEVQSAPGAFERREVELGLSDGIYVEVVRGLSVDDEIKVPGSPQEAG